MARPMDFTLRFQSDLKGVQDLQDLSSELDTVKRNAEDAGAALDLKADVNTEAIDAARTRIRELRTLISDNLGSADFDASPALREIGKLERGIKQLQKADPFEDLSADARAAGNDAERALERAFHPDLRGAGKEGLGEFKDEAQQSAREGAASFTGEFEDVGDYIQEVAANAFAGFGALGAAAGLAAAAGIGILVTKYQEAQERAEELRDTQLELFRGDSGTPYIESVFEVYKQLVDDGYVEKLALDLRRAAAGQKELVETVTAEGGIVTYYRDVAAGQDDFNRTLEETVTLARERAREVETERAAQERLIDAFAGSGDAALKAEAAYYRLSKAQEDLGTSSDLAATYVESAQAALLDALSGLGTKAAAATQEALDAGLSGDRLETALRRAGLTDRQIQLVVNAQADVTEAEQTMETFRRQQQILDIALQVGELAQQGLIDQVEAIALQEKFVGLDADAEDYNETVADLLGQLLQKTVKVGGDDRGYEQTRRNLRAPPDKTAKFLAKLDPYARAQAERELDAIARQRVADYYATVHVSGGPGGSGGITQFDAPLQRDLRSLARSAAALTSPTVTSPGLQVNVTVDDTRLKDLVRVEVTDYATGVARRVRQGMTP